MTYLASSDDRLPFQLLTDELIERQYLAWELCGQTIAPLRRFYDGIRFASSERLLRHHQRVTVFALSDELLKFVMIVFQTVSPRNRLAVLKDWAKHIREMNRRGLTFRLVDSSKVEADRLVEVRKQMATQRIGDSAVLVQPPGHRLVFGDEVDQKFLTWHTETEQLLAECCVTTSDQAHEFLLDFGSRNPCFPKTPSDYSIKAWVLHRSHGKTQLEIAHELGVSQSTVSRLIAAACECFEFHSCGNSAEQPPIPMDPAQIDLGKRADGRIPR